MQLVTSELFQTLCFCETNAVKDQLSASWRPWTCLLLFENFCLKSFPLENCAGILGEAADVRFFNALQS